MFRPSTLLLLFLISAEVAYGQISDDFSDRDLTANPPWMGELELWQTGRLLESDALQSAGSAHPDTIHLTLAAQISYGRWEFTFAHQGVNLSTFNGARIFLAVNAPNPADDVEGYYVQLGTNNSDAISFWRVDGGLDRRVELARSTMALVDGDSSYRRIEVDRNVDANWQITVDDSLILQAHDARYAAGEYFIIWVKHTGQGAQAFYFDDLLIEPTAYESPPPPPPTPRPAPGDVVINEIQFDPLPGGSEFIELFNRSGTTFDLLGFSFRDSRSPPNAVADVSSLLEPGGYAVLVADDEAFAGQFRRTPFVAPSRWPALNNGGDVVVLEFEDEIVDSVAYGDDAAPTGYSLERVDPDGPSEPFNFAPSRNPFGATPGETNSVFEPDVDGPNLVFAELIERDVLQLHFNEPLEPTSLTPDAIQIGSADVQSIAPVANHVYRIQLHDEAHASIVEVHGATDRRGNVSDLVAAPISYFPEHGDIVVNEIMYEPRTNADDGLPDQTEYVELFNRSARRVSLGDLYSTRRLDEHGATDTTNVSLSLTGLDAGGFYVIARDSSLVDQLPDVPFAVISSMSLPNGGDVFRLHHPIGLLIDSLSYDPSLHHPDLVDTRGIALERVDVDGPSNEPGNWTSSVDASGGTPGRVNSIRARPAPDLPEGGLTVSPNPFSPDRDGHEDVASIAYRLRLRPSLVRIRIFDHHGTVVRRLVPAQLVGESGTFYWDGLDDVGRRLRTGIYVVLMEAFDDSRKESETYRAAVVLARTY